MNILYVHSTPLDSEKANLVQVLNMCHAFCRVGNKVTLITRRSENRDCDSVPFVVSRFGIDVPFETLFFEGGFSIMGRLKEIGALFSNVKDLIREELSKKKYDIIFIRAPIFMPFVKSMGVPVIYELHNDTIHYDSKILNWFWERMFLSYTHKGYIQKVVVISEALKDIWIRKGIGTKSPLVYHDGFNPSHYQDGLSIDDARKSLGLRNDRPIVMYTGSLYRDRGIELIIEAASKIKDAMFYIVGGPEDRVKHYRQLAERQGLEHIVFVGRVNQKDVSRYLFAADVLLLIFTDAVPTIDYCSPLKMFEYMASGRTILAHAFPTIKEVLSDGQNAVFSDPGDPDDFVDKLRSALGAGKQLGDNARKAAFEKYTWEKRAERIIQYLNEPAPHVKLSDKSKAEVSS